MKKDEDKLSHSMVHYLLAVHKLKEGKGYARITDIAKELGLAKGSVSMAIHSLKKRRLIEEEEGTKFPVLTELGHEEVHRILSSRTLLFYFLRDFVGVSDSVAAADSCQMEHLMSPETSIRLFYFMKDLSCVHDDQNLPEKFRFKTTLDLSQYKDPDDFVKVQEGDKYLE